jgi:hypothetical protein
MGRRGEREERHGGSSMGMAGVAIDCFFLPFDGETEETCEDRPDWSPALVAMVRSLVDTFVFSDAGLVEDASEFFFKAACFFLFTTSVQTLVDVSSNSLSDLGVEG